ncbi:MAG: hypothetical protein COB66_02095 [Coxiella sp. (in: Bacteria)]|nr:MAG: hypothetical protein COB66_02095 [Coxiella sp. (in: g-proteobacteria)]
MPGIFFGQETEELQKTKYGLPDIALQYLAASASGVIFVAPQATGIMLRQTMSTYNEGDRRMGNSGLNLAVCKIRA